MSLTPISDWCRHCALFFSDSGQYIGKQKIKFKEKTFSYDGRLFNFLPDDSTFFKIKTLFYTTKYFQYNINNPMSLIIKPQKDIVPVVDSRVHKAIYENKLIEDLNSLAGFNFIEFIKKYWLIFVVAGVLIWYFATGQELFGSSAQSVTSFNPVPDNVSNITIIRGGP